MDVKLVAATLAGACVALVWTMHRITNAMQNLDGALDVIIGEDDEEPEPDDVPIWGQFPGR